VNKSSFILGDVKYVFDEKSNNYSKYYFTARGWMKESLTPINVIKKNELRKNAVQSIQGLRRS